jgi:hypothetical protein
VLFFLGRGFPAASKRSSPANRASVQFGTSALYRNRTEGQNADEASPIRHQEMANE